MKYYPLFLNLKDKPVLLVGAGHVAAQKIPALLESQAKITVVAPEALWAIQLLAKDKKLAWRKRAFRPSDVKGMRLVIAATNREAVHNKIAAQARKQRIWVNIVDVTPLCDFIAPAIVSRGDLQVAISTGGAAPAMAKFLRRKLEPILGPEYGQFVELAQRYRPAIMKLPKPQRQSLWECLASEGFLDQLKREGAERTEQHLKEWIYGKHSV